MKKGFLVKKTLPVLLALVMLITVMPIGVLPVSASTNSYTYDAEAAVDFAESHCSGETQLAKSACTEGWLCAEFVANCLKAGGFNITGYTATVNAKAQGEYMQEFGTKMSGTITGNAIHDYDFILPLKKGDIVYIVYDDTVTASGHVLLCSGEKDSSGNWLFYAHNSRKVKETYTLTGEYLDAATEMYAIILDDSSNNAAETTATTEIERIKTQISNTYTQALSLSGKSSFDGWCGSYVQYQLRALSITTGSDSDITGNGNKMYTNAKEGTTSKGYTKIKYAGNDCLTNLISANNGSDVYNIYVSWTHQYGYTNSNPGAGHVTFIHAILDGIVYFSESYDSSYGKEGVPQSCSVATFMTRYNNFYGDAIGAVHFTSNSSASSSTNSTNPDDYTFPTRDLYYTSPVMTGDDVAWVQAFLYQMGYDIEIDKSYGPATKAVVTQFQKDNGLSADGCIGQETRPQMEAMWEAAKHTTCTWDSGTVTKAATHTSTGIKTYTCTYCNATKTETIAKLSEHTYGAWQNLNSTQHKRTCACGEYETANHTWNSGVITQQATCTTAGTKTYTCTGCNATKTESIAANGHSFGAWQNDNSEQHKHTCACGVSETASHVWDNGTITKAATHTEEGIRTYTCTVCSATKTESISIIATHSYGEWEKYDDAQHKRVCACGSYELSDHDWNSGIITTPATNTSEGVRTYTCLYCNATKTESIPTLAGNHEWDEGVVTQTPVCVGEGVKTYTCIKCGETKEVTIYFTNHSYGGWESCSDTQHKRVCACGENEVIAEHVWDTSIITKNPSCTENGIKTHYCSTCGASKTEDISKLEHQWDNGVITVSPTTTQEGVMTYKCLCCDEYKTEKIPMLEISENAPQIVVSSCEALVGRRFTVTVAVKNNPGVASLILKIAYDDTILSLVDVKYDSTIGGQTIVPTDFDSPITLYWINAFSNMEKDVIFATLTFEVKDTAASGVCTDITVSYNANDVYNLNEENVAFGLQNGAVEIIDGIPGDINGDGELNNKDVTRLMQYYANWDVEVNEAALDVNGDGALNNKDVSRLMQYLAGWNVEIY